MRRPQRAPRFDGWAATQAIARRLKLPDAEYRAAILPPDSIPNGGASTLADITAAWRLLRTDATDVQAEVTAIHADPAPSPGAQGRDDASL